MAKLRISTDEVLPRLAQVVGVVNSKSPLPILGNVVFQTRQDGGLTITASDSEIWLTVKVPCIQSDEPMTFCVLATDIFKVLSNLKGKEVEMTLDKETHTVQGTYQKGRFSLPYEDATDFPRPMMDMTDAKTILMHATNFIRAIGKANFAVANEKLRPILNGVHFIFSNTGMIAEATDGQKLIRYVDKTIENFGDGESETAFVLPKKPVTLLIGLLNGYSDDVKIEFTPSCVAISNTEFKMMARLLEGKYPTLERIIPTDNTIKVTIPKNDLIEALKRVLPMGDAVSELVSLAFSIGNLTVATTDINYSKSADESIDCDYASPELSIGFNGSYLLDVLANIEDDNVCIMLKDATRAGLFKPESIDESEDYVSLLMPIFLL